MELSCKTNSASVVSPVSLVSLVSPLASASASTSELTTYLRRRVETLTAEKQSLKDEITILKKRVATSALAGAPPSKKARTKTPGQKKKLFEKWSNTLIRESKKHKELYDCYKPDAYDVTVKETRLWTLAEFEDLFDGHGNKIQPLPDNKPKASVTILRFYPYSDVQRFFSNVGGAEIAETGYGVQLWRKKRNGGSFKYDTAEARMESMEVRYNKSKQALSLVFGLVYGGLLEKLEPNSELDLNLSESCGASPK